MPAHHLTYDRQWSADYADETAGADWQQRFGGPAENVQLQEYVRQVGLRIVAQTGSHRPVDFVVLRGWSPNAFVYAGPKVCITTGLIYKLQREGELAAVLAHEIGHVRAGHTAHKPTHQDEYEADALALRYIAHAGYDPVNMVTVLQKLESNFDSGQEDSTSPLAGQHPRTHNRIRRLQLVLDSEYPYTRPHNGPDPAGKFQAVHDLLAQQVPLHH